MNRSSSQTQYYQPLQLSHQEMVLNIILGLFLLIASKFLVLPLCVLIILKDIYPAILNDLTWWQLILVCAGLVLDLVLFIPLAVTLIDRVRVSFLKDELNSKRCSFFVSWFLLGLSVCVSLTPLNVLNISFFLSEHINDFNAAYVHINWLLYLIDFIVILGFSISLLTGIIFGANVSLIYNLRFDPATKYIVIFLILPIKRKFNLLAQTNFAAIVQGNEANKVFLCEWLQKKGLAKLKLVNCNFSGLKLANISLQESTLIGVNFSGGNLNNAQIDKATLINVEMEQCELVSISLHESYLENVDFSGSELQGSSFRGSKIENCKLLNSQLNNTDLSRTILKNIDTDPKTDLTGICIDSWSIDAESLNKFEKNQVICKHFYSRYTGEGNLRFDPDSRCPKGIELENGKFKEFYDGMQEWFVLYIERGLPYPVELISFYQYLEQDQGKYFKIVGFRKVGEHYWKVMFEPVQLEEKNLDTENLIISFNKIASAIGQKSKMLKDYMSSGNFAALSTVINKFFEESKRLNQQLARKRYKNLEDIAFDFMDHLCEESPVIDVTHQNILPEVNSSIVDDLELECLKVDRDSLVTAIKSINDELTACRNQNLNTPSDQEKVKINRSIEALQQTRDTKLQELRVLQDKIKEIENRL